MKTGPITRTFQDQARTPEELRAMLVLMRKASTHFYGSAFNIGCHPFIEFTGLMNEYIKVCAEAAEQGIDFTMASTHTGQALPFKQHHLAYLAEKLNCIYGPSLLASPELARAFVETLFEGRARLVFDDGGSP